MIFKWFILLWTAKKVLLFPTALSEIKLKKCLSSYQRRNLLCVIPKQLCNNIYATLKLLSCSICNEILCSFVTWIMNIKKFQASNYSLLFCFDHKDKSSLSDKLVKRNVLTAEKFVHEHDNFLWGFIFNPFHHFKPSKMKVVKVAQLVWNSRSRW